MEGIVLRKVRILFNYIRREWNALAKIEGISGFQSRILHTIYLRDEKNLETVQKDLETIFNSSKSSMCELLKTMEQNNLIERVDSPSQRAKKIVLTSKGKEFEEKTSSIGLYLEDIVTSNLSKEDLDNFNKIIDVMIKNIGKDDRLNIDD